MNLIKISATDSTNSQLRRMLTEGAVENGTVVWADRQTKGRGQRGANWVSEDGKNLTFSVLRSDISLPSVQFFRLNMAVSLGVAGVLRGLNIPNIRIKWPNDILSGDYKICGLLLENTLQGPQISSSVIGVGLNVHQTDFPGLPGAASLQSLTGRKFDRTHLLETLVHAILREIDALNSEVATSQRTRYEALLYGMGNTRRFRAENGPAFTGVIQGVSDEGRLVVDVAGNLQTYSFKEIEYRYETGG